MPHPEQADQSSEAMRGRLNELQEPLGAIILSATQLMDRVFPHAPHPKDVDKDFPVTAVSSINIEPTRELTIRIAEGRLLRVDRNPASSTPTFPYIRVMSSSPEDEKTRKRIQVRQFYADSDPRSDYPLDIDTSIWDENERSHLGFVGYGYIGQEGSVRHISDDLEAARVVAINALELGADDV